MCDCQKTIGFDGTEADFAKTAIASAPTAALPQPPKGRQPRDWSKVMGNLDRGIASIDKAADVVNKLRQRNPAPSASAGGGGIELGSGSTSGSSATVGGFQVPKPIIWGLIAFAGLTVIAFSYYFIKRR